MLISITTFGQIGKGDDSTKYIRYQNQYGQRMPRSWWDSVAHMPYGDTATFPKPCRPGAIMMHTDKNFYKWNGGGWASMGSGGGSADSSIFATNYRVDTAKANLRTQIAGKQATGNYITALTGDVTASGPGSSAATIANNAVTNAKAAQMAAHTFKGNNTGSTANASDLTATQLTAELNVFGAGVKGLVPAAGGSPSSLKYLSEDGTFSTPSGGGGTKTWQQSLIDGSTFSQPNGITQAGFPINYDGKVANKDTFRIRDGRTALFMGVSTDLGIAGGTVFRIAWPQMVAGNLGAQCWNRAADGSTLNSYGGSGDSSFESKYPTIPNYDPSIIYIFLGNYAINEAIHGTDSTTMRASYIKWIDSLHVHRGYPYNRIVVLNGHRSPTVLASFPQLANLALAIMHVAIEKGCNWIDSYGQTVGDASLSFTDGTHLNLKGQTVLANDVFNTVTAIDSANSTMVNNLQALNALTVLGKTYVKDIENKGNDSTDGYSTVKGDFNLYGNFTRNATFNQGVSITGDNTLSRIWNLFNGGGEQWGIQMGSGSGSYHTDVFAGSSTADSVRLGHKASGTFITTLATAEALTRIASSAFKVSGISTFDDNVTLNKGLSVAGDATLGRTINLFNNGSELFGMRVNGSSPYKLQMYSLYSNSASGVELGWMASDGVTFHNVLGAYQSGNVIIPGLASGGTAPTTSGTTKNVVSDANGMLSFSDNVLDKFHTATGNSGTSETDLYSYTVAANKLGSNDQSLNLDFSGLVSDITTTNQIRVYFAGTEILNTGGVTITGTGAWSLRALITRETSSTAIATVTFNIGSASVSSLVTITDLTSLDFTTTNIFKVTGTASGSGASSNDITGKHGLLTFIP